MMSKTFCYFVFYYNSLLFFILWFLWFSIFVIFYDYYIFVINYVLNTHLHRRAIYMFRECYRAMVNIFSFACITFYIFWLNFRVVIQQLVQNCKFYTFFSYNFYISLSSYRYRIVTEKAGFIFKITIWWKTLVDREKEIS